MGETSIWHNKLYNLLKSHKLKIPKIEYVAHATCELKVSEKEIITFTVPITLNRQVKRHIQEAMYGEIHAGFSEYLAECTKEPKIKKDKKTETKWFSILPTIPLQQDSIGHKMLEKMGWIKGTSLGIRGDDITEPLPIVVLKKRSGIQ